MTIRAERGSMLIIGYLMLATILTLAITQTAQTLHGIRLESKAVTLDQAAALAEAGLDNAVIQLDLGRAVPSSYLSPGTTGCYPNGGSCSAALLQTLPTGQFSTTLTGPTPGAPGIAGRLYTVDVIAQSDAAGTSGVARHLRAQVERLLTSSPGFNGVTTSGTPPAGTPGLTIQSGARIDSYDSRVDTDGPNASNFDNAVITINGGNPFAVVADNNTELHGTLYRDGTVSGAPLITGNGGVPLPQGADLYYPTPKPPSQPAASATCPADVSTSAADFVLPSNTTLTGAGPYCYHAINLNGYNLTYSNPAVEIYVADTISFGSGAAGGNVTMAGGTVRTRGLTMSSAAHQLRTSGVTDWYVIGNVSISGSADVNNPIDGSARVPDHFRLYVTQDPAHSLPDTVYISSNGSEYYGLVYAPDLAVQIMGGGEVTGAVVGNSVTLQGSSARIHYDEAFASITNYPGWLNQQADSDPTTPGLQSSPDPNANNVAVKVRGARLAFP